MEKSVWERERKRKRQMWWNSVYYKQNQVFTIAVRSRTSRSNVMTCTSQNPSSQLWEYVTGKFLHGWERKGRHGANDTHVLPKPSSFVSSQIWSRLLYTKQRLHMPASCPSKRDPLLEERLLNIVAITKGRLQVTEAEQKKRTRIVTSRKDEQGRTGKSQVSVAQVNLEGSSSSQQRMAILHTHTQPFFNACITYDVDSMHHLAPWGSRQPHFPPRERPPKWCLQRTSHKEQCIKYP